MRANLWLLLALVVFTVLWRVFPHPLNMTPLAALALFAGARSRHVGVGFSFPLAALLVSDLVLGGHATMPWVYGAMLLVVLMGTLARGRGLPGHALAGVAGSLTFYLVTNFGVWMSAGYYAPDLSGLLASYVAGLPFLWKTLAGDFFFVVLFFGLFAMFGQHVTSPREATVKAG